MKFDTAATAPSINSQYLYFQREQLRKKKKLNFPDLSKLQLKPGGDAGARLVKRVFAQATLSRG